ncbi:CSN-associated deubiquitinating enzyme Ubp12 [Tulasnella sp. 408]|nr:CSN-associated deubiquitinating enzyme Ubp12 [Tulasnella sp. 408]
MIGSLKNKALALGDTWYLISQRWYHDWQCTCAVIAFQSTFEAESRVNAVDNSSLAGSKAGELKSALIEGVDYELLPEEAWNLLVDWYGTPSHTFGRKVVAEGAFQHHSIDLYPVSLLLYLCRLYNPPPPTPVEMSKTATLKALEENFIKPMLRDQYLDSPPFRVWRIDPTGIHEDWDDEPSENEGYTPASVGKHNPSPLFGSFKSPFDPQTTTLEEATIGPGDRIIVECEFNGSFTVQVAWPDPRHAAAPSPEQDRALLPPGIIREASTQAFHIHGDRESTFEDPVSLAYDEANSGPPPIDLRAGESQNTRPAQSPSEPRSNSQDGLLPRGGINRPSPEHYMQVAVKRLRAVKITGHPDSFTIDHKLQKASIVI